MNAIAQASTAPVTGPKLDNRRVLAGIVDLLIVSAGAAVILFAGDALTADRSEVRGALGAVILGWTLYYFFALESGDGQTVGKKLMKLRVMRADGSPAGMREIAVRTVLRVVDNYLIGLIVMLATGDRRQRLGDLAAGTIVADASAPAAARAVSAEDQVATAPAEEADELGDEPDADGDREADEPSASGEQTSTITLPARPAPPATLSDLASPEAPAVPEMRPFPPVDEPEASEPASMDEPASTDEPAPPAKSFDEDVRPAPEPYAPIMAEDAVLGEPVAEESDLGSDLAADEPEVVPDEPAGDEPVADEPADDEPVVVKSVETVSAIDLIMGGPAHDQDPEGSPESSQDPEAPASH